MVLKWRLIKEVLRVAPDYAKAQNLSSYGAGENTMVVEDTLSRIEEERRHLCEYNEDTANGSRLEPVDSRKTSGDRKKATFSRLHWSFLFYFL